VIFSSALWTILDKDAQSVSARETAAGSGTKEQLEPQEQRSEKRKGNSPTN